MTMLIENDWNRWVIQTARTWEDLAPLFQYTHHNILDEGHLLMIDNVLEINRLIDEQQHGEFDINFIYQVAELCDRLYQRTMEHFEEEESVLKELNVEDANIHREQHLHILRSMEALIMDLSEGRFAVSLDLKLQILEWTLVHMVEEDAKLLNHEKLIKSFYSVESFDIIEKMLPRIGIKRLDRAYIEVSKQLYAVLKETEHNEKVVQLTHIIKEIKGLFTYEYKVMERFSISSKESHHYQHLTYIHFLEEQISSSNLLDMNQILSKWFEHIFNYDIKELSLETWAIKQLKQYKAKFLPSLEKDELDADHERIADCFLEQENILKNVIQKKVDQGLVEELKMMMDILKTNLGGHFEREKRIWSDNQNEVDIANHEKDHEIILENLTYFLRLLDANQLALAYHSWKNLFLEWLHHVIFVDVAFFHQLDKVLSTSQRKDVEP